MNNRRDFFEKEDKGLVTYEMCKEIVQEDGMDLFIIPREFLSQELCDIAIRNNIRSIFWVPRCFKTTRMYIFHFLYQCYQKEFETIPYDIEISELYEKVIRINGITLGYIPQELRTKELCDMAFKSNISSFPEIPEKYKTKEMCDIAVNDSGWLIRYVPNHFLTSELCERVIKNNSENIRCIPDHFKSLKLCKMAIKDNSENLKYVPKHFITPEFCLLVPYGHGEHFPEYIKDGDFQTDINDVQSLKAYIRFTPKYKQTKEYIEAFLTKASLHDIDMEAYHICLEIIPKELYPLLINSSISIIKDFLKEQFSKVG